MKIIIIESELYLAQSIAAKLIEEDFEVETYSSIKDALGSDGDVYLISTSISGQSCMPIIHKFKHKIIILMVNYINNDTVGEPMRNGAHDYIVKPFMIEDLMRKIEHHRDVCMLEKINHFQQQYINDMLKEVEHDLDISKLNIPLIIHTNYQRAADKLAIELASYSSMPLKYIALDSEAWEKDIENTNNQCIVYIVKFERLKKNDRGRLWEILQGRHFVLSTTEIDEYPYETVSINTKNKLYDQNEILTIDEYVQHVVKNFQYKLPDTELSKKLGISRKSLWEKRKKYELFKKK